MTQITARTLMDALQWIHTQRHMESGHDFNQRTGAPTHRWYRNHFDKLRVPMNAPWFRQFLAFTRPNPRPHDDRMYALTPGGKKALYRYLYMIADESSAPLIPIMRRQHP